MPEGIQHPEQPLRVLLIEDCRNDCELILRQLRRCGFAPQSTRVDNKPELRRALEEGPWDIIITDQKLPTFSATEALALIRRVGFNIPTLCVTGSVDPENIKEVLEAGACALISKDDMAPLCAAVTSALNRRMSRPESPGHSSPGDGSV
jgi:CheY-like chemotaxis protein